MLDREKEARQKSRAIKSNGYFHLIHSRNEMECFWWWKWLWKIQCPLKSKLYCWFLFSRKALTWDNLCQRGREGPGRCYLCNMDSETNAHTGFECSFTRRVWSEIEVKLRYNNLWNGLTILDCVQNWVLHAEARYRSLPVIVSWFIWKA